MKVIIAGGGTGGHIFPAIAIANAIEKAHPGSHILFVGANGKMEMDKVPQAGYKIIGLDIVGFNRTNLFKNIMLPFKLWKSQQVAKTIINDFQPDIAIGVGGFASYPILSMAQKLGIPTLIQEQNSYAGKSNKRLSHKAKSICVAYDRMDKFFPKELITKTGNPVRATIANSKISKTEGLQYFDLPDDKLTLLIVGGSLGAKSINEAIKDNIDKILSKNVQLIWQTGTLFENEAQSIARNKGKNIVATTFIKEMEYAYAAADIVISRAGALAIAELCIVAKPVIFVPYPFAAEDHQTSNAMALVHNNAAICIKDEHVSAHLYEKLRPLIEDENLRINMQKNIKSMAINNATDRIVEIVDQIISHNKK